MILKQLKFREFSLLLGLTILIMIGSSNTSTHAGSLTNYDKIEAQTGLVSTESTGTMITNNKFSSSFGIKSNDFQPEWVEKLPTISPSARQHSAIAYDSFNDKTILFGGHNGSVLNDTWDMIIQLIYGKT